MTFRFWGCVLLISFLFSCGADKGMMSDWKELDLLEHGIPFSILSPDSADVKTLDYGKIMKDVSIKKGDDYFVQIFASDANSTDLAVVKEEQVKEVKREKHFSKIVEETDAGFIYESQKDSTIYYGFRYVRLQGSKEYILQNGFKGFFTEEQARSMFKAVSTQSSK